MAQNQHYVHQSYLRGCWHDEKHVLYYQKDPLHMKRRAIRGILSGPNNLNVVDADGRITHDYEDFWSSLESECGEAMKQVRESRALGSPEEQAAISKTAALHWSRGKAMRSASEALGQQASEHSYCGLLDRKEELAAVFQQDFSRPPQPGEVEALARAAFEARRSSNQVSVDSMLNQFEKFLAWTENKYLELLISESPTVGFSTSDSPVVHVNRKTGQVGLACGLALCDADLVLLPLGRHLACAFTVNQSSPLRLDSEWVEKVNKELIWPNAHEHVISHPDEPSSVVVPDQD